MSVSGGEGVGTDPYHSYGMMELYTPSVLPALWAARQQKGELSFDVINRLHVPIALISMAMLPVLIALTLRRRREADIGLLTATVLIALLANAVICGVLSNPHSRYGARLAWTATLAVFLVSMRLAVKPKQRG